MANQEHLEILKQGIDAWNAWRAEHPLTQPDFSKAFLAGANLKGADLQRANLQRANLHGANLREADLQGADLHGANLHGANLRGANLHGANLPEEIRAQALAMGALIEEDRPGDEPGRVSALVEINVPGETLFLLDQERLVNAAGAFMEALGFELEAEEEPIHGSFFQRLIFRMKKALTSPEVEALYEEAKTTLRANLADKPAAESTAHLAEAAGNLITSLDNIPNAAVRLGKLVVVKVTEEGEPRILVETISVALQHKLEEDPHFLRDPKAVVAFIDAEAEEPEAKQTEAEEPEEAPRLPSQSTTPPATPEEPETEEPEAEELEEAPRLRSQSTTPSATPPAPSPEPSADKPPQSAPAPGVTPER